MNYPKSVEKKKKILLKITAARYTVVIIHFTRRKDRCEIRSWKKKEKGKISTILFI